MRLLLTLMLVALPQVATANPCGVSLKAVEADIARLEQYYPLAHSNIDCDAPVIAAHILMCDSSYEFPNQLWRMGRLDDLAWIYAYENATKNDVDDENPPLHSSFIAERDACTDEACLCNVLIEHTDGSLGGESPYAP